MPVLAESIGVKLARAETVERIRDDESCISDSNDRF